ncbi:MAG: flagellar export protein FliJ [Thermodesulfobacteriota bacterium]
MAFHFQLEPVLTVRKNLEEQVQLKLGREQMVLNGQQLRLADLREKRAAIDRALEDLKKQTLPARTFLLYLESMRIHELQMHLLTSAIAAQQQVVERVRAELAEAMKQRKIIEALRENALQQYLAETRRKEQNESDEQALLRHGRGYAL